MLQWLVINYPETLRGVSSWLNGGVITGVPVEAALRPASSRVDALKGGVSSDGAIH